MRRVAVLLVLVLCLVGLVSTGGAGEHRPEATAADLAPLPAVSADSVVDSYGVGIHLPFLDTPYQDATAVADALSELGVRHVRDDLFMNNPRQYAGIRTVAERGIRFNLIMGRPTSAATPADYVETVATQLPRGAVESIEGTNEWDLTGRPDWVLEMHTRQRDLYEAAKADPATEDLPVLAPALAFKWNYLPAGDMSRYADHANGHMYPGGFRPSNEISQITTAIRGSIPTKPLVTTEAGYHNALNTTNGHRPVPEDVAGVYTPRVLLEHVLRGEERVYTYELIDEFVDPGLTDPEAHFGLLRRDWSPKPAYTAMKNLLGLLADPGPEFSTAPLPLKASGFPGDGKYLLTQKRNSQHVLLLWRDVAIYDPVSKQRQPVTPTNVTLQLAESKSFGVFRPSSGSGPVSQSTGSSLEVPMDGEVTAVTIDPVPSAPEPQSVKATAGNASAKVAWTMPATKAEVTGFEVVRQPGAKVISAPPSARSVADSGLVNGTRYTYTVKALAAEGDSAAVAAAPVVPVTTPSAPRVTRTSVGSGSVTVTWAAPASGGSRITGYQLISGSRSMTVGPSVRKATLKRLPKNRRLRVALRATNAVGKGALAYTGYVRTRR